MRLYPTPEQESFLRQWCGQTRFIYNLAVEQQSFYTQGAYSHARPPNSSERSRQLTELRKDIDWLGAGPAVVQQQALRDFDQAQKNFFSNPAHFSPPTRKRRSHMSFRVVGAPASSLRILNTRNGSVSIPKIGRIRVRFSKRTDPAPAFESKSYRVTCDPKGQWYVSFVLPDHAPAFDVSDTRTSIGVDLGITTTVVTSDGQHYRAPNPRRKERKVQELKSRASKAKKNSKKRRRLNRKAFALQHEITRRRRDWTEKITTRIVADHDFVVVEDLKVRNMIAAPAPRPNLDPDPDPAGPEFLPNGAAAKAGLNKAIARSSWSHFRTRLENKAARAKQPSSVVPVPAHHTSQECSRCHDVSPDNRVSQSLFRCRRCTMTMHADKNAARNIRARGLALVRTTDDPDSLAPARGQRAQSRIAAQATLREENLRAVA
jgi:transposase